jgi:hypothetical protein
MAQQMILTTNSVLFVSAMAFALYHAVLGLLWLPSYENFWAGVLALVIYLVTVALTILVRKQMKLSIPQALFNFSATCIVPMLINFQISTDLAGTYATWYVAAMATLMSATAIRQQRIISWLGISITVAQVVVWGGLSAVANTGVIGAFVLVFAGQAVAYGLAKADRDVKAFGKLATKAARQMASSSAASAERKLRLEKALAGALPMLNLIVKNQGKLAEADKVEARLLEAQLRDEIRGRGLMSDNIRQAVRAARVRGVEVLVLDEGGLDDVDEIERDRILLEAAGAVGEISAGRLTLRAPKGESWKMTVAATRPGVATPDLWLRLG